MRCNKQPDRFPMIDPSTQRALHGASNFRDLGGYKGADGSRVRHGCVFRSDHLADLTPADIAALQAMHLAHSIDFRGVAECAALPYEIAGVTNVAMPIEPTAVRRVQDMLASGRTPGTAETVELMCDTYRGFVHENGPTFGRFFRHLLSHSTPVVFHCTAGKDRTGLAAALLLLALGVDRDTVMQDYLLSNQLYRRSRSVEEAGPAHVMDVLWQVQPAFLQAAFDAMDRFHGGVSCYLAGPMGINSDEQEQLHQALLDR